jgi:outer membrane lipoprotein SlyB
MSPLFFIQKENDMKHIITIFALISALPAFAAGYTGQDYSGTEARRVYQIESGRVVDLRQVRIDDTSTTSQVVGGSIGGLLGGIVGQAVGSTSNYAVSAVLATAGAAGGVAVSNAILRSDGLEYIVRMDDGRTIAVVQEIDSANPIRIGDRVRMVHGNNVKIAKIKDL